MNDVRFRLTPPCGQHCCERKRKGSQLEFERQEEHEEHKVKENSSSGMCKKVDGGLFLLDIFSIFAILAALAVRFVIINFQCLLAILGSQAILFFL